ncbi:MAG: hypothetical protein GY705_18295, partial [Bacteroidetes bacterium]|nr:hypothetical protein [Bacteroidota bacterium]
MNKHITRRCYGIARYARSPQSAGVILQKKMNTKKYKEICSLPDVLPIGIVQNTIRILKRENSKETEVLENILLSEAIPFPIKFNGKENDKYYKIILTEEEIENIVEILFDQEAFSVLPDGIPTEETANYVNLVNIWSELSEYKK